MLLIPDDFFDPEPPARSATLDEIRIVELSAKSTLAKNPTIRISSESCSVNPSHTHKSGDCCSSFSRTFNTISLSDGKKFDINCRSYRCEKHKQQWSSKWGAIISEQIAANPVTLLVNLTTPQWLNATEFSVAMRKFIRLFRSAFGKTEYVKVMEEAKSHLMPHAHLLFCCEDLVIPEKTKSHYDRCKREKKQLSWPYNLFESIKEFWTKALLFAKPNLVLRTKNKTAVVWCDKPMGRGERAAQYALGYITGQNQKGKGEELSHNWRGRKITFSKGFFDKPTRIIWQELLTKWFGEREKVDYGLVFSPTADRQMRLKWLEKSSSTKTKTILDEQTGELSVVIQSTVDPRYLLQLGMIYEGHNRHNDFTGPEAEKIYGYDYLSKDKLFEIDIGGT